MLRRRRDDRIHIELPVRIWGIGMDGKPFNENVKTVDISPAGARLLWAQCRARVGDTIGLQYKDEKTRFRVMWTRAATREVGIAAAEPEKSIWEKIEAPAPRPQGPVQKPPTEQAGKPATAPRDRRTRRRYPCEGGVQIRRHDGSSIWGALTDVSADGCYVQTTATFPIGTEVDLTMNAKDVEIQCKAQVRTCHPGIGVGIAFTLVSIEARRQLNRLIDILSGVVPTPVSQPSVAIDIPARTPISAEEWKSLESLLQSAPKDVDPRILSEFKRAVEHTQQTAWAVRTWVEMKKQQRDAFSLMALVEKRRVHLANLLLRELLMDYQSNALGDDTEGFQDLVGAIKKFHIALGL